MVEFGSVGLGFLLRGREVACRRAWRAMLPSVKGPTTVVAVVGAGNVGCALAAHLSLRGVEVRLCTRSEARLAPIRRTGAIKIAGAVTGVGRIAMLTTSLDEAVDGAHIVAVTVPTPALPHYAPALVEATTAQQLLWLNPGHSGGALYLAAEFRRGNVERELRICQLSTASHGSRMTSPTSVKSFGLPPHRWPPFPPDISTNATYSSSPSYPSSSTRPAASWNST